MGKMCERPREGMRGYLRALAAERQKLRRARVLPAFLLLPLLPALMGSFNYQQNLGILKDGWYALWSQHTLFAAFFFLPALTAVCCSYLCRLEHLGHNWNAVRGAPLSASCIYFAKLAAAGAFLLLGLLFTGALFVGSGLLLGLPGLPPPALLLWLARGWLGALAVAACQLSCSLIIRSFSVPVGVSLMGGVLGLVLLSRGKGLLFPYALLPLGMAVNHPTDPMPCSAAAFAGSALLFILLFSSIGILYLKMRDVTAN